MPETLTIDKQTYTYKLGKQLPFGGLEAEKYSVEVYPPDGKAPFAMIAKFYAEEDHFWPEIIHNNYQQLQALGLPVPPMATTAVIEGVPCFLTYDIRHQDQRYDTLVWGANAYPTEYEKRSLIAINPSMKEVREIFLPIVLKLSDHGISVSSDALTISRTIVPQHSRLQPWLLDYANILGPRQHNNNLAELEKYIHFMRQQLLAARQEYS